VSTQTAINVTALAQIWAGGIQLATFMIDSAGSLMTVDRANASRRTITLTLTEGYLLDPPGMVVPTSAESLFAPFGNEVIAYSGLVYDTGAIEYVQVGIFGIDKFAIGDTGKDLVCTITGSDRSAEIIRSGLISNYTVAPSANVGTEIARLLSTAVVGFPLQYNFTPTSFLTPSTALSLTPSTDPWTEATKMATDSGCELYFDVNGVCCFLPVPDPTTLPISFMYPEGTSSLMDELDRTLDRTATPNYIICDYTGPASAPFRAIAIDNDPTSPTYIGGKYGRFRLYKQSDLYGSLTQAQADADTQLLLGKGNLDSVEIKAIPKPDHDVDDVVGVVRTRAGISNALYVIDSFTLGFGNAGVLDFVGRTVSGVS
jgi:hypothetical protein